MRRNLVQPDPKRSVNRRLSFRYCVRINASTSDRQTSDNEEKEVQTEGKKQRMQTETLCPNESSRNQRKRVKAGRGSYRHEEIYKIKQETRNPKQGQHEEQHLFQLTATWQTSHGGRGSWSGPWRYLDQTSLYVSVPLSAGLLSILDLLWLVHPDVLIWIIVPPADPASCIPSHQTHFASDLRIFEPSSVQVESDLCRTKLLWESDELMWVTSARRHRGVSHQTMVTN